MQNFPYRPGNLGPSKLMSRSPVGLFAVGEITGGKLRKIIAVGAEVIINYIQDHCHPQRVSRIYKPSERIRTPRRDAMERTCQRRRIPIQIVPEIPPPA